RRATTATARATGVRYDGPWVGAQRGTVRVERRRAAAEHGGGLVKARYRTGLAHRPAHVVGQLDRLAQVAHLRVAEQFTAVPHGLGPHVVMFLEDLLPLGHRPLTDGAEQPLPELGS